MITNSERINICALMLDPYNTMPGQRFRLEQWESYLTQKDFLIDYFSFTDYSLRKVIYEEGKIIEKSLGLSKALFRRLGHILNASKYDVIYLYRTASMIGPAWLEKILSLKKKPIIYDFDDAIFLSNTSKANQKFSWAKFPQKTADICRLSTSVTVGNSYLAEYARQFNKNVFVIPTSIDTNIYQPVEKNLKKDKLVVGWTGSSTSQYHLEAFEPLLDELLQRYNVELRVISDRKPDFKKIDCNWQTWSSEKEVEITSQIDIGIMPIPDDNWSKGKCAAKALQYMALGIPAVCSDVGANKDVIDHGVNGFLAETKDDWLKYLGVLINNANIREKFGIQARETVVTKYSMKKCAELFAEVVRRTVKD
jgi:glycosyltransferase involved in cell wall biosynthesis